MSVINPLFIRWNDEIIRTMIILDNQSDLFLIKGNYSDQI